MAENAHLSTVIVPVGPAGGGMHAAYVFRSFALPESDDDPAFVEPVHRVLGIAAGADDISILWGRTPSPSADDPIVVEHGVRHVLRLPVSPLPLGKGAVVGATDRDGRTIVLRATDFFTSEGHDVAVLESFSADGSALIDVHTREFVAGDIDGFDCREASIVLDLIHETEGGLAVPGIEGVLPDEAAAAEAVRALAVAGRCQFRPRPRDDAERVAAAAGLRSLVSDGTEADVDPEGWATPEGLPTPEGIVLSLVEIAAPPAALPPAEAESVPDGGGDALGAVVAAIDGPDGPDGNEAAVTEAGVEKVEAGPAAAKPTSEDMERPEVRRETEVPRPDESADAEDDPFAEGIRILSGR